MSGTAARGGPTSRHTASYSSRNPNGFPSTGKSGCVARTAAGAPIGAYSATNITRVSGQAPGYLPGELAAVHVREQGVGQDQLIERRVLPKHPERLATVARDPPVVAQGPQQPAEGRASAGATLDDEHDRGTEQ